MGSKKASIPQFRVFFRSIVRNVNFSFRSYCISDADDVEKHIFWPIIDSSSLYITIHTPSRCCYTPNRWAWSLAVTWQRWRSHYSIRSCRKHPVIRKLDVPIFHRTRVIANWSFTLRE